MTTIHQGDLSIIEQNATRKTSSKRYPVLAEVTPHKLLDTLVKHNRLKNDAALARLLGVLPFYISHIRHRRIPVGPGVLLRMHEATDIPIATLKAWVAESK